MIIQIYWDGNSTSDRGYTMFDIEYYQIKADKDQWQSEIHVVPCIEGLVRYTASHKDSSEFFLYKFIEDCELIGGLRRWLWESDGIHNEPSKDDKLHYGERYDHIMNTVNEYAEKYGLYVNID